MSPEKLCNTNPRVFISRESSQVIGIRTYQKLNNQVYLRRHKYALGPTQTYFSPSRKAWGKMSSTRSKRTHNTFMPKNINCITSIITLGDTEKTKTEKKVPKNSLVDICFTALHNKPVGVLRMAFRARKVFEIFEKRVTGVSVCPTSLNIFFLQKITTDIQDPYL